MDREFKTKAFRLYDFDGNENWRTYVKRVDISSVNHNDKLLKIKAKWYKREVDPEFELEWLSTANQTETCSGRNSERGAASSSTQQSTQRSERIPSDRDPPSLSIITILHFASAILGIVSLVPLIPLSVQRAFLQTVIVSSLLKTYEQFGLPKIRPFDALKTWIARALNTTDCQYGFLALIFFRRAPTMLIIIPPTVIAVYHSVVFLNRRLGSYTLWKRFGASLYNYLAYRQNNALVMNAVCEISTGFVLIGQLLVNTQNIIMLLLYWQWLRARYFTPDSARIHRHVWASLGSKLDPLLNRIPFLRVPLNFAKNWFTAAQ